MLHDLRLHTRVQDGGGDDFLKMEVPVKAAVILQPKWIETQEVPVQEPAPSELLVRVMASGICGTDVHIFQGEYLGSYPVIPGHEFAGVVEKVGSAVTRFKTGDRVAVEPNLPCNNCVNCLNNRHNFCLNWQAVGVTRPGGMAQYVSVPEKAVFDIGDLPFEQGAFMEPLSCVLHGLERLDLAIAARVAIIGAGPIGLLLLQGLRLKGVAEVLAVDKNPDRAAFAQTLGADRSLTRLADIERDAYDAVVDATGAVAVMSRTLDFARPGGKILLFGVPPSGQKMTVEAFPIFRKGLTILSSFTSLRNSYQALGLLKSRRVLVEKLISHRLPLEELQGGIELIERGSELVCKVMILPNG
jgi:2-desacetyl-2-hydroxyethyl bacteriochlorophyllide A dehydrogenase